MKNSLPLDIRICEQIFRAQMIATPVSPVYGNGERKSKAKHVFHPVQARRAAGEPVRRRQRSARKAGTVVGAVRDLECLVGAGVQHRMRTHDVARPHH